MNFLFVCSRNQLRSPTAEAVFANIEGVSALSAGTNHDSETPLSGDLIEWADTIFCMEASHKRKVQNAFRAILREKKLTVLGIADNYSYLDPELVRLIRAKFPQWFTD